jgi:hypothetical protein
MGLRVLREDPDQEAPGLARYLEAGSKLDGWAAELAPLVERWAADQERYRATLASTASLGPGKAIEAWNGLKAETAPVYHRAIDRKAAEAQQAVKAKAQARQAQTEQADRQKLSQLEPRLEELGRNRDFAGALAAAAETRNAMETEVVQAELDQALVPYQLLADLKAYLIERVEAAAPSGTVPGLGRAVRAADAEGLRTADGAFVPWSRVSTRSWLALFDYYLARTEIPPEEQAKLLLGCAVFAQREGTPEQARTFGERAVERDPKVEKDLRALLPEPAGSD